MIWPFVFWAALICMALSILLVYLIGSAGAGLIAISLAVIGIISSCKCDRAEGKDPWRAFRRKKR